MIESNLNAVSKSPWTHRAELRRFVHLPIFVHLDYDKGPNTEKSVLLETLHMTHESVDILQDPYVRSLLADPAAKSVVDDVLLTRKTHCQNELRKLCGKADYIASELGACAVERYIRLVVAKVRAAVTAKREMQFGWEGEDKEYRATVLGKVLPPQSPCPESLDYPLPSRVSTKLDKLIELLDSRCGPKFSGIILVEQRATAVMLYQLLLTHPRAKHLKCATFVGTSNSSSRRPSVSDLVDMSQQNQVLNDFGFKRYNLIIATSVLEEGIDISSCNLVIYFNKPANLKSFI